MLHIVSGRETIDGLPQGIRGAFPVRQSVRQDRRHGSRLEFKPS